MTTPTEVSGRLDDVVLLDVREDDEWEAGHIDGSVHVPLGQLGARFGEVPTDRTVVCVCRSGARSATATAALRRAGVDAENLEGGVQAWETAGLDLVDGSGGPGTAI